MASMESVDPTRNGARYYPWWLDRLADDVTGEGAAMQGVLHGAEAVRTLVTDARKIYQNQQFQFTGDFGDNGFLEEYTCQIEGQPTSVVVTGWPSLAAFPSDVGATCCVTGRESTSELITAGPDRSSSAPKAARPLITVAIKNRSSMAPTKTCCWVCW